MKNKNIHSILALVAVLIIMGNEVFALNTNSVRAYPVPLNPNSSLLTIDDPSGSLAGVNSVKLYVYDVNGDLVVTKTYNSLPLLWNGRNSKGRYVKPGLYILKIVFEDASGGYGRKLIRILVNY